MANLSCPECGPQGGTGRVTLAFSVVDCSLCDGSAPRGIAKHVQAQIDPVYVPSGPFRIVAFGSTTEGHETAGAAREVMLEALEQYAEAFEDSEGMVTWWNAGSDLPTTGTSAQYREYMAGMSTHRIAECAKSCSKHPEAVRVARKVLSCDS